MRYPEFIKPGDTLGFVAPSFGCSTEPYRSGFKNALDILSKRGYSTHLGPNCYEAKGIGISNSPDQCGRELTDFYLNQEDQALLSCGGGELMCETLPYIDFAAISQARPKWYMGYSDNTNFTYLSASLCDTAAIYGPNAAAFGMQPWHPSLEDAFQLLEGRSSTVHNYEQWEAESKKDENHPLEPYNCTEAMKIITYLGGSPMEAPDLHLTGRLLGGNMDCLSNLAGTEFDHTREFANRYQEDGIIWFLEACDLNVFGIRRALWQMKHTGWFTHAKAFLIGRPHCFGESMMGLDQYRSVVDQLAELELPVIMDLDIGHLPPMMPLITGASCRLDLTNNQFSITYTWK